MTAPNVCPTGVGSLLSQEGGGQRGMFSVANISEMLTHSLPQSAFYFFHILFATFGACEDIHKIVPFAVNILSHCVFLPSSVAGNLFYPI